MSMTKSDIDDALAAWAGDKAPEKSKKEKSKKKGKGEEETEEDKKAKMEEALASWAGDMEESSDSKLDLNKKGEKKEGGGGEGGGDDVREALREAVLRLKEAEGRVREEKRELEVLVGENVAYQKEIGESLNTVRQLKEELTVLKDEEEKLKVMKEVNNVDSNDALKGLLFQLIEQNNSAREQVEQMLPNIEEVEGYGKAKAGKKGKKD